MCVYIYIYIYKHKNTEKNARSRNTYSAQILVTQDDRTMFALC